MNSAHRSPESAHRSGEPELKTEVFIVKTPDDKDAVIVSFVDDGENNGIFLYEPGADPMELTAVGQEDHASEFEHAHIYGETVDGEEVQWPGDGMTTFADRDAAVERAAEDHANLEQTHGVLRDQAQGLVDVVRGQHSAGVGHDLGTWTLCANPLCKAASAVAVEL